MAVIAESWGLNSTAIVSMGIQDYCVKVNFLKLLISLKINMPYYHYYIFHFKKSNLVKVLGCLPRVWIFLL